MNRTTLALATAAASLSLTAPSAHAQTGFYVGGGIGLSDQRVLPTVAFAGFPPPMAEDSGQDFAWKAFAGINLDVPFINLALEGGYVDLGSPAVSAANVNEVNANTTGFDAFAIGAIDTGPISVFGKVGVIVWDLDISTQPLMADLGESGANFAGGAGAQLRLGKIQVRGEVEYFAIDELDDSFLFSASLIWQF